MNRALDGIRVAIGLLIIMSGLLNLGLFGFTPSEAGPSGRQFQMALQESTYLLPLITAVFIIGGLSIATGRFSALSTLVLLPMSTNIVLFHTLMDGGEKPVAIVFFVLNIFLVWYHRKAYQPLLRSRL